MNEELNKQAESSYRLAEQRAAQYFAALRKQVDQKAYAKELKNDIRSWQKYHIQRPGILSLLSKQRNKDSNSYQGHIQWLDRMGKLDRYLERSISYIFMRDLGKALDSKETQEQINRTVNRLKKQLRESEGSGTEEQIGFFSTKGLYRWAQEEGIEPAVIWLLGKLKTVSSSLPEELNPAQAKRKLIKIIAGVLMHAFDEMEDGISPDERSRKLDEAVRLGYAYGLTYPFIDDLLDSTILSEQEKKQFSELIRSAIVTGVVPELSGWQGNNADLITYVHSELKEAFHLIQIRQRPENRQHFFGQAYVFFQSQEVDRGKDLEYERYTNEELYIPVILKSSSSRLIVRSVINAPEDEGFDRRTFYYGIYNQLADDFTDMFDDLEAGAVTPYTYYLKHHDKRDDLINPFELYWTVISNLIHQVYHADPQVREVILSRAINGLKRTEQRLGKDKYEEIMALFTAGFPEFNSLIQMMVRKADDVDFFDKLLRDRMLSDMKKEDREREDFLDAAKKVRNDLNGMLAIKENEEDPLLQDSIPEAANYSLEGGGKRLRSVLTWLMGVKGYGLQEKDITPLMKSLEYMHTASLIYDDLPSQDDAVIRRGRATLHHVHNTAIAELTGLYLTQKGIEEQASLDTFNPKAVLSLIRYSSQTVMEMCRGQAMDLESKGKLLSMEQLKTMCFYKTGIAFEASLIMPAILAGAEETEKEALKIFARHAGIAFQIKDDLLDAGGEASKLGKPTGQDIANGSSTFVTVLGFEEAEKEMWEQYCLAVEVLPEIPRNTAFLKHFLDYVVNRDH